MSVQFPNHPKNVFLKSANSSEQNEASFRGAHVMVDLYGASFDVLNDQSTIARVFEKAVPKGGATLLGIQLKQFEPQGVTALALLSESHVSIHTYPEKGSAFLDVFTCGDCDPELITNEIASELGAKLKDVKYVPRGEQKSRPGRPEETESSGQLRAEIVLENIAPGIDRSWEIEDVHAHVRTQYQDVLIGKTAQGLSLFCENERQSTEQSQLIYHEGQIVPAALMANKVDRVLVIGSSEGVVSQLAVDLGAQDIVHVDIDEACVRLCAEFLPYGYSPEDITKSIEGDSKVRILFEDAFTFIDRCAENGETFDVIVMDLPDEQLGDAQQNRLYQEGFLKKVGLLLTVEGAFITQAGSTTYWRNETLVRTLKRMQNVFATSVFFEMEEQDWAWTVGTNFLCENAAERMIARLSQLSYVPEFIDEQSIRKATIVPASIRKQLKL